MKDTILSAGLEIGAVSVKWAGRSGNLAFLKIIPHGGDPLTVVRRLFHQYHITAQSPVIVTGPSAKSLLDLPYRSETECMEKALSHLGYAPDILLSLGGETFSLYPLKTGKIKNIIATSKCAAGTGEFIVQQFQRMGMSVTEGISAGRKGKKVNLATRCSVHCKSDATHKLNKGECTPGDIAKSLISDLAKKVGEMVELSQWPSRTIVLCGGVVLNPLFVEYFQNRFPDSRILVFPESPCLEAFGASLYAAELSPQQESEKILKPSKVEFERLKPLLNVKNLLDYRASPGKSAVLTNASYILGVDAGSTTTKAVLMNTDDNTIAASCYLRTLGNPVQATKNCVKALTEQVGHKDIHIICAAATGSARELISVYLENCQSFNEILAHARAAAYEMPEVDTVFEIGGQDSKYISFQNGVPVDYAMNEGCSAGTGSFLEESASVDMGVKVTDISPIAEKSKTPIAFGERCAAFINTDLRNALQQGALREDVIAGLVYSIADNYISRIVGPRHIGQKVLFLGGVALNKSVGLAMAARTRRNIIVPSHPELMGSLGAALKAKDFLFEGRTREKHPELSDFLSGEMEVKDTFSCKSCDNHCEIKNILIRGKHYPFGGLCSKFEKQRHGKIDAEGRDLIELRNNIMFEEFGPEKVNTPRGTIGLPMALSTYELFPFYAKLINALGFNAVLSRPSKAGNDKTIAPICYPCELVHGAAYDLINRAVDFILIPHVIRINDAPDNSPGHTCPSTTVIPDIIGAAFKNSRQRLLSPHIGMSESLKNTSIKEIGRTGKILGIKRRLAERAAEIAFDHYERFKKVYRTRMADEAEKISGEPSVVVAGRPYVVCSSDVNLALPRKITSRGYHVLSVDMLPLLENSGHPRDVWHFTRQIENAVAHVKQNPALHICLVSCFSCGPDASMYHWIRRELSGRSFCYLEIDSHTAHAGFETRVGAFIDILEENRFRGKLNENTGRHAGATV